MDTSIPVEGWLTLAEAAAEFNISVDTLRRKIKRGTIPARQVQTRFGPTWQVCLTLPWADAGGNADGSAEGGGHPAEGSGQGGAEGRATLELVALVRQLHGDLVQKAEAAAMWQARAMMLDAELQSARGELRALQAPQEQPQPAQDAPQSPPAASQPMNASATRGGARRAWWRFWRS